jgi:hypothetical protein
MNDMPFPWCVYAEHQSKAAACGRITDRSWGIEKGLTKFLAAVESGSIPDKDEFQRDVSRAVETGSWVERNHARLQRTYLKPQYHHSEHRVMARVRLAEIRERVSPSEWDLLMAVAAGVAYSEMTGVTAGGARTQVARLRARLRPAGRSI